MSGGVTITNVKKESKVEYSSLKEQDANGQMPASAKEVKITIESDNLDTAIWGTLQTAEANHTAQYVQINGMKGTQKMVISALVPVVDLKAAEAGKNVRRVLSGQGIFDSEADMVTLTLT